jgi:hypothetical protein
MERSGEQLDPTTNISPQNLAPLHVFHKLTNLSFTAVFFYHGLHDGLPDGFAALLDALLDATPSLQKILLPVGHFSSSHGEVPIDRLVRKLLHGPSLCPYLQDIASPNFPTDWAAFLWILTGRSLRSLSSSTGLPKSIHTLRFLLLPHPQIVQQLEDAMGGRRLTPHYSIPPCEEWCMHSQGLLNPVARRNQVCFMCHSGRLERGCLYLPDRTPLDAYSCLKWDYSPDSWEHITVPML